jgi:hypothetical protein
MPQAFLEELDYPNLKGNRVNAWTSTGPKLGVEGNFVIAKKAVILRFRSKSANLI